LGRKKNGTIAKSSIKPGKEGGERNFRQPTIEFEREKGKKRYLPAYEREEEKMTRKLREGREGERLASVCGLGKKGREKACRA